MVQTLKPPVEDPTPVGHVCPVLVPESPVWNADYTGVTTDQLVALTDEQLAEVDPLVVNLIVAKDIPSLSNLDLWRYQQQVNEWAYEFATQYLPWCEETYQQEPEAYHHDHSLFKVGMITQFFSKQLGITYNEEQQNITSVRYLNPGDLFLNGIIDTRQGTCGNIAALQLIFAWRVGWPVSLACIHSHFLLRHDDGENIFNIETTCSKDGSFYWTRDGQQIRLQSIPEKGLACGSELKALSPRERLGAFIGLRARHYQDLFFQHHDRTFLRCAERDYLLARYLFPNNRRMHQWQMLLSAVLGMGRFENTENGHPDTFGKILREIHAFEQGVHSCQAPMPLPSHPGASVCSGRRNNDDIFETLGSI
jgi:hypothetical protein